jgi:hypothetical protein
MKKTFILLFCFILSISLVYSGRSIPLDFDDQESYILPIYVGDRVYFEFDDDVHSIILDGTKENRVEFDIFLYQNTKFNNQPPQYAFLDLYRDLKLDIDRDKVFDFNIDLDSFDANKAILIISKINEEKNVVNPLDMEENNFEFNMYFVIGGGIIVCFIILFLVNKYVISKKNTYF